MCICIFLLLIFVLLTAVIKSTWDFTISLSRRPLYNEFNAILRVDIYADESVGMVFMEMKIKYQ